MAMVMTEAGPRSSRSNTVFHREKFLQRPGQYGGQFLPGHQLQPAAENAASDRPHNGIPFLDQIRPPCVTNNAERSARRMGSKRATNQLIAGHDIAGHIQFFQSKNFRKVAISFDHSRGRRLKIRLRKLGLHKEVS
jgi:hypothetical protein